MTTVATTDRDDRPRRRPEEGLCVYDSHDPVEFLRADATPPLVAPTSRGEDKSVELMRGRTLAVTRLYEE